MAQCVFCKTDTQLYISEQPICQQCDEKRQQRSTDANCANEQRERENSIEAIIDNETLRRRSASMQS